jgi:diaminopimelate decarboxylase/aspartate kinase
VVLKFGGTSVASIERWQTIAQILRGHLSQGLRPLVVCSALSGISNLLERLLSTAEQGQDVTPLLEEVFTKHRDLARDMDLDADAQIGDRFEELTRLARGIRLVEEASPRVRARVMSMGELMSTRLGAAWLEGQGLHTTWQDARDILLTEAGDASSTTRPETHYLSGRCSHEADPELEAQLRAADGDILLTQGFIASDDSGDTCLLGRGGSDTSAAYMAARVGADRLEIWTDVPGMFTTNPRQVSGARLLRHVDYAEAEQLALMGAKVLHPRCIAPVANHSIPLHLKCTTAPDMVGTVISSAAPSGVPQVKAVLARKEMALLSIDVDSALENIGFLEETSACFRRRGLSIDMVSASETNITFALDPTVNVIDDSEIERLMADLQQIADVKLLGPGAAVSLVGSNIRAILHELGPVFERFEDKRVYMVSQAADDLNFTFIVAEDEADRLVSDLHAQLFPPGLTDPAFGRSWEDLFSAERDEPRVLAGWWQQHRDELLREGERGTPCYVYSAAAVDDAVDAIGTLPLERIFYSLKANANFELLDHLHARGVGFQCGSPGELARVADRYDDLTGRIVFAPHVASAEDYRRAFALGAHVVVGSVRPLENWPEVFEGQDILLRIDPGRGASGRAFVPTAGPQSKFGIAPSQARRAKEAANAAGARVVGLHAHAGSGLRTPRTWRDIARLLVPIAKEFPSVRVLDLGGGLGVPERVGHSQVDLEKVAAGLTAIREELPRLSLWMEPGRFFVARSGVLLAQVWDVTRKDGSTFITVDAGMNSLIRPALYGAFHETVNLSRFGERRTMVADVVGPLADSADVLAHERQLPTTEPGDILLIANAGAYGHSMASSYNGFSPAREVVRGFEGSSRG